MSTINRSPHVEGLPDEGQERDRARKLAERYRCPFVDLRDQRIDPELFRSIPAELMFRLQFRSAGGARQPAGGRRRRPEPGAAQR